jgi:rhodanese-related sulfurtransferase
MILTVKNIDMKSIFLLLFLFTATLHSCQSQPSTGLVDAKTFKAQIQKTTDPVILDVRSPGEYAEGYIEHAINMDYNGDSFEKEVAKLDKSKTYFVYCLAGGRSNSAATHMRKAGFQNVFDLDGGIRAWKKSELPLVKRSIND